MGISELFHNVFPERAMFFIFVAYMALFINLGSCDRGVEVVCCHGELRCHATATFQPRSTHAGLMITASKSADGSYSYNPITVVFMTELVKLVAASVIFLREGNTIAQCVHSKATCPQRPLP